MWKKDELFPRCLEQVRDASGPKAEPSLKSALTSNSTSLFDRYAHGVCIQCFTCSFQATQVSFQATDQLRPSELISPHPSPPLLSLLTHQPIPIPSLLLLDHPSPGCPPCCFSCQALQHYSLGPSSIAATHSHCTKSPKPFQTRTIVFCPVLLKTNRFFFVIDICKVSIT